MQKLSEEAAADSAALQRTAFPILVALSFSHLLNDMMQSLVPAIYPIIKDAYHLDFGQIGLITFTFQLTASLFQPLVGAYTDRHPLPYSLVAGMGMTLMGLIVLANAGSYGMLILAAGLVGTGSSIFHPESTRMARLASGGRHGFAQSLFQVGGQTGSAVGPLLAAFIVVPHGQGSVAWFSLAALLAMIVLFHVRQWYARQSPPRRGSSAAPASNPEFARIRPKVAFAVGILVLLMFSKSAYSASFSSYYTFYLMGQFNVSVQASQLMLFLFLVSSAAGSLIGGHLGDRIGRRKIIWFSILGALPFTVALPYVNLLWTGIFTVIIAAIMASAFPAILIYAMELLPGRVGMIAGMFYGLSFGLGGLSAAFLGELADITSITTVYHLCAFLPLLGLLTWFLPDIRRQ
jgi:FSR family fosmidomycin resistance protein-like MFS transporter